MRTSERIIAIILVGLAAACNAPEQAKLAELEAQPILAEEAEREVREIHDAYYRTLVEEGSDAALVRYYGDDFTYVGVDGKIIDKARLRARMQRNELQHFELEDDLRRVSIYDNVAVLSGHATTTATDRGEEQTGMEGYTEVWVRRDGRWELVAEQITPQE